MRQVCDMAAVDRRESVRQEGRLLVVLKVVETYLNFCKCKLMQF